MEELRAGRSIGYAGFGFSAFPGSGGVPPGLFVENAIEGSPADEAGLGQGQKVITAIDGTPVRSFRSYCEAVDGIESGESVDVEYISPTGPRITTLEFM
jgi:S1-C subfamily serine protease